jgi:glycopeptide antibiotics resistance protein
MSSNELITKHKANLCLSLLIEIFLLMFEHAYKKTYYIQKTTLTTVLFTILYVELFSIRSRYDESLINRAHY